MHLCLQLAELQMQMFSSLERDDCKQLSVTCKCFYDQAMNQVWKRLDSFVPMARCMSDAIVEAMPPGAGILMHQINFIRAPSQADWQMFCKHAHRVRDFRGQCLWITLVPSVNCVALSNDAREVVVAFLLRLGAEGRPRSLFPNLVKYTAPVSDKMFTLPRYTPFVCGDTLGSLDLSRENHTSDDYPPMDPDPYTTLFETLPIFGSRWFRLRMVRLFLPLPKEDEPRDRYLNMLDEFLAQLRELRTLEVYLALQESLINHLSELPQLRFMTLTLDCVVHRGPSPRLLPHGFRALQELHITTFVTEDLISLLQVLPCAGRLTKLVLILNLQSVKDSESQPTWFGRLLASASRAHTLRHLFIHI
ncbi:hypothetical protein BC629DRAFT_534535 [Irpex lacteus]|nr:hypothetical protein BC629DRAFT_534535 [Irpex lacteus]